MKAGLILEGGAMRGLFTAGVMDVLMQDGVRDGCQFVLATHSPILTACPGAAIYEIDEGRLTPTDYEHLSSVQFLSHFLKAHAHLLGAE